VKTKYVILKIGTLDVPFVFSGLMNHADVARALGGIDKVVSAGFCCSNSETWTCYGESVSCAVKSRGSIDDEILNDHLGG
jgi:hypothetical protein